MPLCIFEALLLLEVDDVDSWVTIPALAMSNTTHRPNYKKIGSKLCPFKWSQVLVKNENYGNFTNLT